LIEEVNLKNNLIILLLCICPYFFSCATMAPTEPVLPELTSKTFNASYDEVWNATTDSIKNEGFTIKLSEKDQGLLGTDFQDTTHKLFAYNATYGAQINSILCVAEKTKINAIIKKENDSQSLVTLDVNSIHFGYENEFLGTGSKKWSVKSNGVLEKSIFYDIANRLPILGITSPLTISRKKKLLDEAGDNLKSFTWHIYASVILSSFGSLFILSNPIQKETVLIGNLFLFSGLIYTLIAPSYINAAGQNLKEFAAEK